MARLPVLLVATLTALAVMIAGCAQATPAPTPTKAPVVPTKAAEPTKAPAATVAPTKAAEPTKAAPAPTTAPAAPTAVPAKKVDFPAKGRAISIIVAWAAGGGADIGSRLYAGALEKELGTPVEVVNKVGANGQVGLTEVAKARPDGYTLGTTMLPAVMFLYLDPQRQSAFDRKSFLPLAHQTAEAVAIGVRADSPLKSVKDLVDAAKAKPETVKIGTSGLGGVSHAMILQMQNLTGAKFAPVHFTGAAPGITALLGGHTDVHFDAASNFASQWKSGAVRVLGIADEKENEFFPGIKTLESQGYAVRMTTTRTFSLPAGVPKEIVDILSSASKRAMESADYKKKMAEAGQEVRPLGPEETAAFWDKLETQVKPLMQALTQAQ